MSVFRGYRCTDSLEVDRYSAPQIHANDDYMIVEIDVSSVETQVFLIDLKLSTLYLETPHWAGEQMRLVANALAYSSYQIARRTYLERQTVLLGVWHFGHILGDHAHRLISHCRRGQKCSMAIHQSSNFKGLKSIQAMLDIHQIGSDVKHDRNTDAHIRIFYLRDCLCFFPARNKAIPLSFAQEHVIRNLKKENDPNKKRKILLTSGRKERIANIDILARILRKDSWACINPLITPARLVLKLIYNADMLVSENGSILFNCFLARTKEYYVLASERISSMSIRDNLGGGVYNNFHEGVIRYIRCEALKQSHHPFSDKILVKHSSIPKLY
jgi:hypothetical protein